MYFLYVPSVISLFHHQKESLSEPHPHPPPPQNPPPPPTPTPEQKISSRGNMLLGMLITNDVMKLWQIILIL